MAQQQQPAGEGGANPLLPPRKLIITKAKNINIQKQKSGEEGGGGLGGIGGEAQPPLQQQPRLQLQLQLQQEGPTTNISRYFYPAFHHSIHAFQVYSFRYSSIHSPTALLLQLLALPQVDSARIPSISFLNSLQNHLLFWRVLAGEPM